MLDYIVRYTVVLGDKVECREDIISIEFEEYDCDFVKDFIYDKLEELEETSNIEILHIEPLRDYNVNVYNL